MPKQPWNTKTVRPAFEMTLKAAVKDKSLKRKLLDPDPVKVKNTFSDFAQIEVPTRMTIRFYAEEVMPFNIAMAIPAAKASKTVPKPRQPTWDQCYLGFYNTYLRLQDYEMLDTIFASAELG
jgi:hypothetical protein